MTSGSKKKEAVVGIIKTRRNQLPDNLAFFQKETEHQNVDLNLDYLKQLMISLEDFYTTNSTKLNREWDLIEDREKVIAELLTAEDADTLKTILGTFESGFADPFILRYDMKSRVIDDGD